MKKFFTASNVIQSAFVLCELALYILIITFGFTHTAGRSYIKYSAIVLCFITSIYGVIRCRAEADSLIIAFAMLFTAVADCFLVLLPSNLMNYGLAAFTVVQIIYFIRLYRGRRIYLSLIVRLACLLLCTTVTAALSALDLTVALVSVYFIMLVCNCADAFILVRRSAKHILFAVALAFFICCDICVGLGGMEGVFGVRLPSGVLTVAGHLEWAFYLPSQVLIVLSGRKG